MRLAHHDFDACSRALRELYAETSPQQFPQRLLPLLMQLVPSAYMSWNAFDEKHRIYFITYSPERPDLKPLLPQFTATIHTSPLFDHFQAAAAFPKRISDVMTLRQFKETPMFREYYRHAGVSHQVIFSLPRDKTHVSLALNRLHRDFSERDRAVLSFVSPHIAQAYGNARIASKMAMNLQTVGEGLDSIHRAVIVAGTDETIRWASPLAREWLQEFFPECRHNPRALPMPVKSWIRKNSIITRTRTPNFSELQLPASANCRLIVYCGRSGGGEFVLGLVRERTCIPPEMANAFCLTPREAEILYWISESKTNPEIAMILGGSVRTIHKHVEHLFAKINVENRLAAQRLGLEFRRI